LKSDGNNPKVMVTTQKWW